ncbi:MAG TPA: response regulator [Gaiellaceae bacterium]|nr:response regulator [Gaiellaceae bacterium]
MSEQGQLILVADDDEDILALVSLRLRRLGYRVVQATDGEEALAQVAQERPALVILDLMMPRVDGYEVMRRLRAAPETVSLPVILLSARARSADAAAGLDAGADAYLSKPFRAEELAAAIRGLLGQG